MDDSIYLGTPPGQSWQLTAVSLAEQLRLRFPDAFLRQVTSAVTGAEALDFEVVLDDGDTHSGTFSETGVLALSDGTPQLWADTIAWFLTLLPAGDVVFGMREGNPTPTPFPAEARTSPNAITQFFQSLE